MLSLWKQRRTDVFQTLSQWFDLHPNELALAADMAEQGNYECHVQQESGRELQVPYGSLYTVQARLVTVFLSHTPTSTAAHGGIAGRSIVTHAAVHLPAAQNLLTMDLRKAYQNIKAFKVAEALRRLLKTPCRDMFIEAELRHMIADYLTLICTRDKCLPMGSPSSAALFNLVAAPFDKTIEKIVADIGPSTRYSRYLDDLVISSPSALPNKLAGQIKRAVLVHDLGVVHPNKTHSLSRSRGDELVITGITHDGAGFALTAAKITEIEDSMKRAVLDTPPDLPRAKGLFRFVHSIYGKKRMPRPIRELADRHMGGKA
ncbi:MAG: reverse transcriptase domain-containing protein [Planctomycetota bacterium]|nr:reverse transcriptase domain-containing protein [Planctomycetota bacterium]